METELYGPEAVGDVSASEAVDAVENAFLAYHEGDAEMPAKSYIDLPEFDGDFRSMPAYVEGMGAGVKWVNSHPFNPERFDLPSVMGVMIYSDPETARPLAVMDGTTLTRLRTGAAAGVATRYLAREDASSLGLVGAGAQAYSQVEAVSGEVDVKRVVVADVDEEAVEEFVTSYSDRAFDVEAGSTEEAAGCDVVSTTTPVREPVVRREWIRDGAHVNAMGADAEGKQELDPAILQDARVYVDYWTQCRHSGEVNVPLSRGEISEEDVAGSLGAVVCGDLEGRTGDDDVTVFDSTGLAIQDVAAADLVYSSVDGEPFELVEG